MGYPKHLFIDQDISDVFLCAVCDDVLKEPVVLDPCQHIYCLNCVVEYDVFEVWHPQTCPTDQKRVVKVTDAVVAECKFVCVLNELKMRCPLNEAGCAAIFKLVDLVDHDAVCKFNPKNQKACAGECGAILNRSQIFRKTHDCTKYLKQQLATKEKSFEAELKAKEIELKMKEASLVEKEAQIRSLEKQLVASSTSNSKLIVILMIVFLIFMSLWLCTYIF